MKQNPIIPQSQRFTIAVIVSIVIMSTVAIWAAVSMTAGSNIETSSEVKLVVSETSYDWGSISLKDDKATKEFEIVNEGSEVLKIFDVTTTCTCTSAQFFWDDERSPLFSMHARSNRIVEIPPGKTAKMRVIFDQAFHGPSGVGPATRGILFKTNDINRPEMQFLVQANVTP
jgi:hypothetical protein